MGVTVAVETERVGDNNIGNRLMILLQAIGHSRRGFRHGFNKVYLFVATAPTCVGVFGLAAGVNIGLTVSRSYTDRLIFKVSPEATHGVTLAVC